MNNGRPAAVHDPYRVQLSDRARLEPLQTDG
jgi:hypothetical protein